MKFGANPFPNRRSFFSGGGIDDGETAEEAAIREVIEELDIQQEQIELLGEIDYLVFGRSTIRCFVGRLHLDWQTLQPNDEVARFFTVPLETLLKTSPVYYQLDSELSQIVTFPLNV